MDIKLIAPSLPSDIPLYLHSFYTITDFFPTCTLEGASQILKQIDQILTLYLGTEDYPSTSPLNFLIYFHKVTSFIKLSQINANSLG